MDRGQVIPFRRKASHRGSPRGWKCPITEEPVVDGLHARGSRCWDMFGHPLQIMPASEGWRAIYRYEERVVALPVVCWVLTEYCDGTRAVVGWVPDGTYIGQADSDSYAGFDGYLEPGSLSPLADTLATRPVTQNSETEESK